MVPLIGDLCRVAIFYFIDVNPIGVAESAMEKLRLERQFLPVPERTVRRKTDRPMLGVVQILQIIWQFILRRLVWLAGEVARYLPHDRSVEWYWLRSHGGGQRVHRQGRERQSGSSEKVPAIQDRALNNCHRP